MFASSLSSARHDQLSHDGNNQIDTWQKSKDKLNASLDVLRGKSDEKVVAANADLKAGTTRYSRISTRRSLAIKCIAGLARCWASRHAS
jgi:hypothetical protein